MEPVFNKTFNTLIKSEALYNIDVFPVLKPNSSKCNIKNFFDKDEEFVAWIVEEYIQHRMALYAQNCGYAILDKITGATYHAADQLCSILTIVYFSLSKGFPHLCFICNVYTLHGINIP